MSIPSAGTLRTAMASASPAQLQEALRCAIALLESYAMDCRDPRWPQVIHTQSAPCEMPGLADYGFCQGRIYTDALPWIQGILDGTRHYG